MDGIGADADVTFVLTTNRAEMLERALVDRPGRVDLAMEIPKPGRQAREQLIRLYAGRLALDADLAPVVEATEGATASFIKELLRRAVLAALRSPGEVHALTDADLATATRELTAQHHALTRSLLGHAGDDPEGPGPGPGGGGLVPGGPGPRGPRMHRG
jgi:ATP-dependent 26S proteasome regulatory subunit